MYIRSIYYMPQLLSSTVRRYMSTRRVFLRTTPHFSGANFLHNRSRRFEIPAKRGSDYKWYFSEDTIFAYSYQ